MKDDPDLNRFNTIWFLRHRADGENKLYYYSANYTAKTFQDSLEDLDRLEKEYLDHFKKNIPTNYMNLIANIYNNKGNAEASYYILKNAGFINPKYYKHYQKIIDGVDDYINKAVNRIHFDN